MPVPLALPANLVAAVAIGGVISYIDGSREEFVAGVVAMLIGLTGTIGVSLVVPSSDLFWALIAVGYVGMFGGLFGFRGGVKRASTP